jgi:hypothetical protein
MPKVIPLAYRPTKLHRFIGFVINHANVIRNAAPTIIAKRSVGIGGPPHLINMTAILALTDMHCTNIF